MDDYTLAVLHLEDEIGVSEIVKTTILLLEPACSLTQFFDADAAIAHIEAYTNALDLLLLDIRVPGSTDGIGVARRARELDYSGAIAFTTAFQPPKLELLRELDCIWLPKPVPLNKMQNTLRATRRISS
ncbi:MAG: hypothetical protein IT320_13760 [Anaerolineae bacterium]|nr:hypothetical protein [Anaerolineae bacterium]